MASRAELIDKRLRPALDEGLVVVADRFFLSTYAYQIAGSRPPGDRGHAANRFATGGLVPDLTILLQPPVASALARTDSRGARDRIEAADDDFHHRVAEAFERFDRSVHGNAVTQSRVRSSRSMERVPSTMLRRR